MLYTVGLGELVQMDGRAYRLRLVAESDQRVLDALDRTWARIRAEHPAVPSVVIDIGPGRPSSCTSIGWGEVPVIELNLRPGGSRLTAADVLAYFLHHAAHALAGPETASEGRYHAYAYQAAAEELGLDTGKYTTLGWKNTSPTEDTVALYGPKSGTRRCP